MSVVFSWFRRIRLDLMLGIAAFAVIAAISAVYASSGARPFLPLMVTLDEWVGALLFAPWLSMRLFRSPVVSEEKDSVRLLWYLDRVGQSAFVVFLMDLLTRAVFNLGYKPF